MRPPCSPKARIAPPLLVRRLCVSNSRSANARSSAPAYAEATASCRIWLARSWPHWKSALVTVRPETVPRWQRDGYRRCVVASRTVEIGSPGPLTPGHVDLDGVFGDDGRRTSGT